MRRHTHLDFAQRWCWQLVHFTSVTNLRMSADASYSREWTANVTKVPIGQEIKLWGTLMVSESWQFSNCDARIPVTAFVLVIQERLEKKIWCDFWIPRKKLHQMWIFRKIWLVVISFHRSADFAFVNVSRRNLEKFFLRCLSPVDVRVLQALLGAVFNNVLISNLTSKPTTKKLTMIRHCRTVSGWMVLKLRISEAIQAQRPECLPSERFVAVWHVQKAPNTLISIPVRFWKCAVLNEHFVAKVPPPKIQNCVPAKPCI